MKYQLSIIPLIIFLNIISFQVKGETITNKYLNDSIPQNWTYSPNISQSISSEDKWWTNFNDSVLDSLIDVGIKNNYNILMAYHRIEMAKNAVNMAKSKYFPTLNLSAGWTKSRNAAEINPLVTSNVTTDYYSLGLDMSWQIDLFGQITTQVKEQKANWNASKSQYEGTILTLCGNIATSYMNLRMWQTEYLVALSHANSQRIVYELTETRFKSGLASKLDVAQAKMVYYATMASLPPLKSSIEATINSIGILLGEYPQNIEKVLSVSKPLPNYNQIVQAGIPMDIIRRRPDILQAEYELASYAAAAGVAKKDFLPILSLKGSIGVESKKLDNLFKDKAFTYTIAPTLSWTVFDGLYRNYNIASAKEQLKIGIDNYNLTIMTAYQEVENAVIKYNYSLKSIDAYNIVMQQAQLSLDLSIELYKKGLSAFTNVLDAQMSLLQYNNSLVQAKGNALNALITLYESLGGGWQNMGFENNKK